MNVLDEFKNYNRFNEYLFIRDKTKKSKKIRYENNCD